MNEQGNTGGEMRGGSEVVEAPSQSAIATLIGIFTGPKKTFQALAAKPRGATPAFVYRQHSNAAPMSRRSAPQAV